MSTTLPAGRLRVLLSNTDLNVRAGTQRWVATMARELERRGHVVRVLTVRGNSLYPSIEAHREGNEYDLALLNHNDAFRRAVRIRMTRCVYTAHGFTPPPEWVPPGADAYAAVDELTAAHIPWPATVIRNPVDLQQFTPRRPVSAEPRRVLFMSNKQGRAREVLERACAIAGLELRVVGGVTAVDDPSGPMNDADIVITSCRGVIEALACDRNVYVMDFLGAKGYVDRSNVEKLRLDSFSGHLDSRWPAPEELARELVRGYDPMLRMRGYVVDEHSPSIVVDRYLELAEQVGPARAGLGRAARFIGGPLTSRRSSKALAHARLGRWHEAWGAIRGEQYVPPLLASKLPHGTAVTMPDSMTGPRPEFQQPAA